MDRARKYTDEELKKLERKLSREYATAQKELTKKWKAYMLEVEKQLKPQKAAYEAAVKTGIKSEIAGAKKALENAKRDLTLSSPRYNEMVDNLTDRMAHVNETALAYINDKVPSLYMVNHNAIAPTAKSLGIDFTIINKNTLKNVTMARSLPLPKKLNIAKDKRWSAKFINSQMLQGILQGEPMDKISKRIFPEIVSKADKSKTGWLKRCEQSAIRNARTLVTQAENKGRLDSYHELEDMGTIMKKRWIATADEVTRESHLLLDGEEVDLDETFSNGLMYPGDPEGDPGEVYNCRCSMETVILGFMDADGNINYVDESLHEDSGHHEQIEEEIERREGSEDGNINYLDEQHNDDTEHEKEINEEKKSNIDKEDSKNDGTFAEKWYDQLTNEQKGAVEWYVSGDGMEANNYLRGRGYYSDGHEADDFLKNAINVLDNTIESYGGLKEEHTLYRVLDIRDIIPNANERDIEAFIYGKDGTTGYLKGYKDEAIKSLMGRVNTEYMDKGFMSTTRSKDIALSWGDFTGANNAVVLELDVPKGSRAADLRQFDIKEDPQKEILFARNTRYEIYDIVGFEEGNIIFKGRIKH